MKLDAFTQMKTKCFLTFYNGKINSFYFYPPQGSSSCTAHEQRSFERKAEEDDGKVSLWMADWLTVWTFFFCCFCFFSTSALVWETAIYTGWGSGSGHSHVSARVFVLHLNRRHPEDGHASVSPWRQAEWQTHRGVSCCLAFCPFTHPLRLHHNETPGTHAAARLCLFKFHLHVVESSRVTGCQAEFRSRSSSKQEVVHSQNTV